MKSITVRHLYLKTFLITLAAACAIFLPAMIIDQGYFLFVGDFNSQQIPFYMISHDAIRAGEWGWNWYTDLGANFVGSYTFYLLGSPFFWLTIPLPSSWVPYTLGPLLMLKFACASLTSCIYLKRYVRNQYYAMLGGFLYAFSGFSIYNIFFNHFHEAIVFFPLMLITMDDLMETGRKGPFALAVALNALINYFFFFGEVVFTLLYYFIRLIKKDYERSWNKFLHVAIEAVIGFLMSGVLMLPSVLTVLQNSRVQNFPSGFGIWLYSNKERVPAIFFSLLFPPELPSKQVFLPDASTKWTSLNSYLPIISVSAVLTFLQSKKKHWLSIMIKILLLMAVIPGLNALFVAFNAAYYARWFYMLSLMMILASVITFDRGNEKRLNHNAWVIMCLTMFIILALSLTPQYSGGEFKRLGLYDEEHWLYFAAIAVTSVLSVMAFTLIVPKLRKKPREFILYLMIGILIYAVLYGNFFVFWGKSRSYETKDYLIASAIEGEEKITIPDKDEVIRIDADDALINMGMFWRVSCMRAFHSIVPGSIMDFYKYIGEKRDVSSKIPEDQYAVRALVSVHWYFDRIGSSSNFGDPSEEEPETLMPGYSYYDDMTGYHVWENDYYIPMGFTYRYYTTIGEMDGVADANKAAAMLHSVTMEPSVAAKYTDLLDHIDPKSVNYSKEQYFDDCLEHRAETVDNLKRTRTGVVCETNFQEKRFVFFSIPYDFGWSLKIDGQEADLEKVNVGFMGFRVDAGYHEIELIYETPGLKIGIFVSLAAILMFAVYMLINEEKLKNLILKYKEQILYIFFGGCTTLINMIVYYLSRKLTIGVVPSDIIAWIMAVIFAYVTNKLWVFESKSWKFPYVLKEVGAFFAARLFSLGVDVLFLYVTVEIFHWWEMPMKLIANIIVIILNYILSKLLVFAKKGKSEDGNAEE
ncbi:MAG: YfhO family protein [Firmicutes bacterium]|nr:YfhO family protein [Bacillota bacterium]